MTQLLHGDSNAILPTLAANSIDLICTDPPYGMKFMGSRNEWDKAVPPVELWAKCLRVLKPGAFAFIMSIPRQDCQARMICNLQDAGFEVGFTPLYHVFAQGFPKASNVSKLVDKRAGAERQKIPRLRFNGIPAKGHLASGFVSGVKDAQEMYGDPITAEAQALDGAYCGFQPKPAVELVLVAMKPLAEETYVAQALANGKGVTWLEDGRIPHNGRPPESDWWGKHHRIDSISTFGAGTPDESWESHTQGRFPANVLVSDDALQDGTIHISGDKLQRHSFQKSIENVTAGNTTFTYKASVAQLYRDYLGDAGSFSRYFDLDAWFAERIGELPENVQATFPCLCIPKPAPSEKTAGGKVENRHPTVKSVKLFSYLITIGSRPGDLVLDPFAGSGTTARAGVRLGRRVIAIEREAEYFQTMQQLVAHEQAQTPLLTPPANQFAEENIKSCGNK